MKQVSLFLHLLLAAVLFCCFSPFNGNARASAPVRAQNEITGTVTDDAGLPLPGVSVYIKGSATGTSTGPDGKFSIAAETGQVLVFSFVGMETREVLVKDRSALQIRLKADSKLLDDVVVVGYGTQKKANLTGAVDQIGSEYFENRPMPNVTRGLQGAIPNLNITMTDGKPTRGANYNIRGMTSIGAGGNALVLIDGV
ncbi:MAG TPA: carboxypeptidase-like regulatory domain-containing protein, partial [Anseongella sp.]|nr:carboxypeptidase-like regulatory domain-containing protein [Anseongella sp.]